MMDVIDAIRRKRMEPMNIRFMKRKPNFKKSPETSILWEFTERLVVLACLYHLNLIEKVDSLKK